MNKAAINISVQVFVCVVKFWAESWHLTYILAESPWWSKLKWIKRSIIYLKMFRMNRGYYKNANFPDMYKWTMHAKCVCVCVCVHSQSCPALCDSMDCSLPGCSVYGIFQTKILKWVAISYSRGSSQPRDWTHISYVSWMLYDQCHLGSKLNELYKWTMWKWKCQLLSCVWLCNSMDYSSPGSSVHGIF